MGKKKQNKIGSVLEVVFDASKDFEVKNYDYEYLQGSKSDEFESDLNYVLNKSSLKSEVRIISESIEIVDNLKKSPKRRNKKVSVTDVTKDLCDINFSDSDEECEPKQNNMKKKGPKSDNGKKKIDKLNPPVEKSSHSNGGHNKSGSPIKNDVSDLSSLPQRDESCDKLEPNPCSSPKDSTDKQSNGKQPPRKKDSKKSKEISRPANYNMPPLRIPSPEKVDKRSKNRRTNRNKSIESPETPLFSNSNSKSKSKSVSPSTPVIEEDVLEDISFISNADEDMNQFYDDLCEPEIEVEVKKKKKKSRKKKSATTDILSSINPKENGDKDTDCNKENVDISQNNDEGVPHGDIPTLETKELHKTDEPKEAPLQLPNRQKPVPNQTIRKSSVANLRSIFEKNNESPFDITLRKTNSISNTQDKLPDVLPIKTIIGLSHLQILKLDLKDVKIKTLVGSSSLSKYANTGLTFTIKHTDDLFETENEKVIFFQLCIYIALFEAIGYKKVCQKYDNILQLFGDYREINLETTRTKLTPSNKEVHQNNLDYSVLSYLGHILIWAANLQIKSGVETIYSIYNLDIDPDTVQDYIGGAHLWDRLNRERKCMSSKRWKHIIKFRTAFPFEIDQFTLILRFMKVDVNNLINWN